MASFVLRLMALLALVLMPVGMGAVPAMAAAPMASSEHCGEHSKDQRKPASMDMHCAACAALPAIAGPEQGAELRPELPRLVRAVHAMVNSVPEIATPPPKQA